MAPPDDMRHNVLNAAAATAVSARGNAAAAGCLPAPSLRSAGTDQANTAQAGGTAVVLGGVRFVAVQRGGGRQGGTQAIQGRQERVAVDVLGRHDVLGQDEVPVCQTRVRVRRDEADRFERVEFPPPTAQPATAKRVLRRWTVRTPTKRRQRDDQAATRKGEGIEPRYYSGPRADSVLTLEG